MTIYLKNDSVWNDTIQAVEYDLFEACGDEKRTLRIRFGDYIDNKKSRYVYDDFYKNMRESTDIGSLMRNFYLHLLYRNISH